MIKTKRALVHVIAKCVDCEWEAQNYITGVAAAKKHAKNYNHLVNVEKEWYIHLIIARMVLS